ncbi:hypothetical protein [Streptomyces sp. NPDC055134]
MRLTGAVVCKTDRILLPRQGARHRQSAVGLQGHQVRVDGRLAFVEAEGSFSGRSS